MATRADLRREPSPEPRTLPTFLTVGAGTGAELTITGKSGERETRSYARLLEDGTSGAAVLRSKGVKPGDLVALVASTSFEFVTGCLAIWNASAVVVSIPYPSVGRMSMQDSVSAADRMIAHVRPNAVIASGAYPLGIPENGLVIPSEDLAARARPLRTDPGPEDPALIQFTSGSTSAPRGVVLSHRALASFLAAYRDKIGLVTSDRLCAWLPLYHDLGFVNYLLLALTCGMSMNLMPTSAFLADYGRWLVELCRGDATHSTGPNFAYALVSRSLRSGLAEPVDLAGMKSFSCGGELISPSVVREFLELAAEVGLHPDAFIAGYGLAEASCTVTTCEQRGFHSDHVDREALASGTASPAPAGEGTAEFAAVGTSLAGVEIAISGPDGTPAAERTVGEILVRGTTLMDGYLNDERATKTALVDGDLHTGDLGYIAGGDLYVTGRAKDVIIVRGQNYFAGDIERVAEGVPGVRKGCCVAIPIRTGTSEEIGLIAETKLTSVEEQDECRDRLSRAIWAETGLTPKKVLLVAPGVVPKTTSGKPQRKLARPLLGE